MTLQKVKYLTVLILLSYSISVNANNFEKLNFSLYGEVKGLNTGSISIGSFITSGYKIKDKTVQVKNGLFLFEGEIEFPYAFKLKLVIDSNTILFSKFYL